MSDDSEITSAKLRSRLLTKLHTVLDCSDPDPRYIQAALAYLKQFPPDDDTLSAIKAAEISETLAKTASVMPFASRKQ